MDTAQGQANPTWDNNRFSERVVHTIQHDSQAKKHLKLNDQDDVRAFALGFRNGLGDCGISVSNIEVDKVLPRIQQELQRAA